MPEIQRIPPELVKKIAAGEVITRPANVVKELVENSIDAGASKVEVRIAKGGIEKIQVIDDGRGIISEELHLAFQLHTSSKTTDDLFKISTLGFRGEALSSICAVSQVRCASRHHTQDTGYEITLEACEVTHSRTKKMKVGTTIEVIGLFHNVPARRKFLKSPAAEKKAIFDIMVHLALINYGVHFRLVSIKGREYEVVFESPSRSSLKSAIYDILGGEVANEMVKVDGSAGRWRVNGYISKPSLVRRDRSMMFFRVNGRAVQMRNLKKSVEEGYGAMLMKRSYPVVILDITGETHWVDFNVHPQKIEIRFQSGDDILHDLSRLVTASLSGRQEVGKLHPAGNIDEHIQESFTENNAAEAASNSSNLSLKDEVSTTQTTVGEFFGGAKQARLEGYRVLGHVMKKFALIEAQNELWVMDVHAADERVKFEMYERGKDSLVMSQRLISPLSVPMSSVLLEFVKENKETIARYGFDISTGSDRVLIHAFPAYFDQSPSKEEIIAMFEDSLLGIDQSEESEIVLSTFDKVEYYIVSRMACHGSIRSGYLVEDSATLDVLANLLKCKNPWTCAHGRPTVIKLRENTISGWFSR